MSLIDVTYTLSGSPGAWVYSFSITNNLSPSPIANYGDIFAFDVSVGLPQPAQPYWHYLSDNGWSPGGMIQPNGVGDIIYNYGWTNGTLHPGQTLGGFSFLYQVAQPVQGDIAALAITWTAATTNWPPIEDVYIRGVATSVPEPATWLLLLLLLGFAVIRLARVVRKPASPKAGTG
jgi:hypothetical protein